MHCLAANKHTGDLQASRSAAQDASPRENSWDFQSETPICEECVQLFSSRTSSRHTNVSEHAITRSCMVSMMDRARICSNREKNNTGFIFTEVSVTSVSTKQMSLTLERGIPPLHNLVTSNKLTGKMLVLSISHLLSWTVCKVNHTTYVYDQTLISQSCFSSLESI